MDAAAMLNQAVAAARAGRKAEARRLLETILEADERNEQAWLWLGAVVDDPQERITCLENVLALNPNNETARRGLAALRAASPPPASPISDQPSTTSDNRALIAITIVLTLMLLCTVISIVAFVILSSPG